MFKKGSVLQGYGNTVVQLLTGVSRKGTAKVKVIQPGLLTRVRPGDTINGFAVYNGVIYFENAEG